LRCALQVGSSPGDIANMRQREEFRPCGSAEQWWVANPDPLRSRYNDIGAAAYEPVYAVIRADTTPRLSAGHLGRYARYVRIHEVMEIARLDSLALQRFPRLCPDTANGGSAPHRQ
jgi:hypothetical protein